MDKTYIDNHLDEYKLFICYVCIDKTIEPIDERIDYMRTYFDLQYDKDTGRNPEEKIKKSDDYHWKLLNIDELIDTFKDKDKLNYDKKRMEDLLRDNDFLLAGT